MSCFGLVAAVVLMFVLKINSSIRISNAQSCLWKHILSRPRHLHGCSDWAFTGEVYSQPGDGEKLPCAPASRSLMGELCFVLVYLTFRAQVGVRRLEVGPWRREFLRWIERDSEEGQLLWFNALFLPRFFVLLSPPRSRCTKSLCFRPLSLRTQVYFRV